MFFFCQRVPYWGRKYNTTNIVLFSTNQIVDIFYVSDEFKYISNLLPGYSDNKYKVTSRFPLILIE